MALMSRAAILGAVDIGFEDIDLSDVPGWGTVRIKDLTASERDALEASLTVDAPAGRRGAPARKVSLDNVRAAFCAAALVDESGVLLFTRSDLAALGQKSARALDRIFARIRERNGLSDSDVQELAENFDNGQSGDSHSA